MYASNAGATAYVELHGVFEDLLVRPSRSTLLSQFGLGQSTTEHRRVLAVLTYLRNSR